MGRSRYSKEVRCTVVHMSLFRPEASVPPPKRAFPQWVPHLSHVMKMGHAKYITQHQHHLHNNSRILEYSLSRLFVDLFATTTLPSNDLQPSKSFMQ